jgi:formate hydrogenlyase subunit 3/multisubunit Na+/H+ antiporter MnhD subunit
MVYLLLIAFPVAMSLSSFLLRRQTRLVIVVAVATVLTEIALVTQLPLDTLMLMLGLKLTLDPLGRLFLLAFLCVGGLSFMASWWLPHGENFVPVSLLILSMICATLLLLQEPFTVSLLLISAGLAAVMAIVDLPTGSPTLVGRVTIATALKYMVLMLIAGVMMYMAFVLVTIYRPGASSDRVSPAHLILGLLAVGFGLRLAVVPFHSWLPDLAQSVAPMVSVIIVAVINTTSLLFLINTLHLSRELVTENQRGMAILMGLGVLTAGLGALLALAQTNMRRTLGYLLVYNAGMVLFGLATTTSIGVTGAIFEAFNQIIVSLLLFICLGLLERPDGRPANVVRRDLLRRWPVAGVGFLGGGLALLGLPPFNGFASKLLIYQAAAERGGVYLALLLLATGLALLALLRLARDRLLGADEDMPAEETPILLGTTDLDRPAARRLEREPRGLALLTGALLMLCLAIGLYPDPLLATITDVIRSLTFIQVL